MINNLLDTIVAIATPKGDGAIGIIRLSGEKAFLIAQTLVKKKIKVGIIQRMKIYSDNKLIDFSIVLYFKKPHSFTGEDIIEFHMHGSDLILDSLLFKIINLGARLAEPGEFSFRAFFNGKLDLIQAESVNTLIRSKSVHKNSSILKGLFGVFSKKIKYVNNNILVLRRDLEAFINFPDNVYFDKKHFINNFLIIKNIFFNFLKCIEVNRFDSNLLKIAIVGNTNVGKSSLFNFLLNNKRAIVSSIPGTTRDFIESSYKLDNNDFIFNLVDTAGFNTESESFLEKSSLLKTFEQINEASVIIYMFDITAFDSSDKVFRKILKNFGSKKKIFIVYNKIDILNMDAKYFFDGNFFNFYISIKEKKGVTNLVQQLYKEFQLLDTTLFLITKKKFDMFLHLKKLFIKCENNLISNFNYDLFSEDLKKIYDCLSVILGKQPEDNLVNEIFSNFCLGK